jgi:hypothetical protein
MEDSLKGIFGMAEYYLHNGAVAKKSEAARCVLCANASEEA